MNINYLITAEQFDSVARGYGDTKTMELLRSGQRSKNLLLLHSIYNAASDPKANVPNRATAFLETFQRFEMIERRNPELVGDLMTYPHVGAWLAACHRAWKRKSDDRFELLDHFNNVVAAAALLSGISDEMPVGIRNASVSLPSLGAFEVRNATTAFLTCSDGGFQLSVESPNGLVLLDTNSRDFWRPLRNINAGTHGNEISLVVDDTDPLRNRFQLNADVRLSDDELAEWRQQLNDAWKTLTDHHALVAEGIGAGLCMLVPSRPEQGLTGTSGTSMDAFGAITSTLPRDSMWFANTLVHEFQHAKLGALLDIVDLYDNQPEAIYYAPWRGDPRPLSGLLQGTYAYMGVTDFWRRQCAVDGSHQQLAQVEFARWRGLVARSVQELRASRRFTELGNRFLDGMMETISPWFDEVVPGLLSRFAKEIAADHETTWRLRNLEADPASVADLVSDLVDLPTPPQMWTNSSRNETRADLAVSRIRAVERNFGASHRQDLLTDLLQRPDSRFEACEDNPADLNCVTGNYALAVEGYEAKLQHSPDDIDAFAGLVLCAGHLLEGPAKNLVQDRPELVHQVWKRVAHREISPLVVAERLARIAGNNIDQERRAVSHP